VDLGLELEDIQGVLTAIAPIVGTSRIVAASGRIATAVGVAIAVVEAELDALDED
jgi:hypothetical protein